MRRGKCYIMACCLLGLVSFSTLFAQSNSGKISISNLNTIPEVIVDTQSYSLTVYVVNDDPTQALYDPVSLILSIDGDAGTKLASNILPSQPVAPGDSFSIFIPDYKFDHNRFIATGNGITHDIIIWPITVNTTNPDSASRDVHFVNTQKPSSDLLAVNLLSFPSAIMDGDDYDLSFQVENNDPLFLLYEPVDLYMSVDQGAPILIESGFMPTIPVYPGGAVIVDVNDYIFPASHFAATGNGITHDIIIWPMKTNGSNQSDSVSLQVEYIDQAVFEVEPTDVNGLMVEVNPFYGYQIQITAENIGPISNTNGVGFYAQIDDKDTYLLHSSAQVVAPGGTISSGTFEFHLADLLNVDSSFFNQSHEVHIFVREIDGLNWYKETTFPVIMVLPTQSSSSNAVSNTSFYSPPGTVPQVYPFPNLGNHPTAYHVDPEPSFYPNPVQHVVTFIVPHKPMDHVHFGFVNAAYQPIQNQSWVALGKETTVHFDLTTWQPGIYFYQITVEGKNFSGKIIKQ